MNNYNPVQGILNSNPNGYYNHYMPPLYADGYQNPMFPQNELAVQLSGANPNFQDLNPLAGQNQAVEEPAAAPPAEPEQVKQKHKRRSKNEKNGRDYVCSCGKDYLSYPALYTHIKTKHGGKVPGGADQPPSSRARGRPKKATPSMPDKEKQEAAENANAEAKIPAVSAIDEVLRRYGVLEEDKQPNVALMCSNFLCQLKPEEAQIYYELCEELKTTQYKLPGSKQEMGRAVKSCKTIFAEYLAEMAYKVDKRFFNTLLIFAQLYKDFMNMYGWDLISHYRAVTPEERDTAFTSSQDAEHVPEGSNEFLKSFVPKEYPGFDKKLAADLTLHLCQWLKTNNYTHTTITPVNPML